MAGIAAARAAGLAVKINTVALKGFNDDEFERPGRLGAWRGHGASPSSRSCRSARIASDEPDRVPVARRRARALVARE